MRRWTNGLPGATTRLGAMMAHRGLSASQPWMRADTHAGPELRLHIKAEYIDAALTFVSLPTSSCDARPDHTLALPGSRPNVCSSNEQRTFLEDRGSSVRDPFRTIPQLRMFLPESKGPLSSADTYRARDNIRINHPSAATPSWVLLAAGRSNYRRTCLNLEAG
jgi:hypothetical protein